MDITDRTRPPIAEAIEKAFMWWVQDNGEFAASLRNAKVTNPPPYFLADFAEVDARLPEVVEHMKERKLWGAGFASALQATVRAWREGWVVLDIADDAEEENLAAFKKIDVIYSGGGHSKLLLDSKETWVAKRTASGTYYCIEEQQRIRSISLARLDQYYPGSHQRIITALDLGMETGDMAANDLLYGTTAAPAGPVPENMADTNFNPGG